jgi:CHAT domain-containing protein
VNKVIVAGGALLLLAGACRHEDTGGAGMWRRTVEPRLSTTRSWHSCTEVLVPGHVVADARCEVVPVAGGICDEVIDSREQADRMLVSAPQCTDEAIAALENFSRAEAAALSDLAGAYYVRAQRNDNPADLLRAFDAAQRAVAMQPQPSGAQFNRALILEALSLNAEAIEAWQLAASTDSGEWASEARARRAALIRRTALDGEHQWAQVQTRLDVALDAHDAAVARRLIALFPATSEKYFEEQVLRQWAESPSPQQLGRVTTFAEALSQFFNDRYFADVAAAIVNAHSPVVVERLREGHHRFAEARAAEGPSSALLYDRAAGLLQQAGSPQYLLASLGHSAQIVLLTGDYDAELRTLDAIATNGSQYPSVMARVGLSRLYPDQFSSRYNDFFAAYESAKTAYDAVGDWEDRAALATHVIATMSVVGLKDAAWREAFVAMRNAPRITSLKTQFLLDGATADAALDLNHPEAAWYYQNLVVERVQRSAANGFLVSILDHLARIEIRLQRYEDARRHLDTASRLNAGLGTGLQHALQARLAEAQGEMALHVDPRRAIGSLTEAIGVAGKAEFTTFTAMLFAERAEAFARSGMPAQAAADRREALSQLHAEEKSMLRDRKPGKDDLWNSYFARFEETYDLLIRQLIDDRRIDEAFQYAERARAFEPLDLVRNLPAAPAAFRELVAHVDAVDIIKLRSHLPPGTFLIEYRVFEDQTYAWILGRDVFFSQRLTARRSDVKRWTAALQTAAGRKDSVAFENGLQAPYEGLLKAPLDAIRAAGGGAASIVIVPDRELRGLPFSALRNPDTKRYVIEDHALSMSGSALLYVFALLRDGDLAARDTSALLIGDPAFDRKSTLAGGLQRLAYAPRQVEQVRSLYPRSEVLTGDAATPQQFLRLAGKSAVIDIAAHGVVNGDAPSQSFLLFAPSDGESGVLSAGMLMKDLHTDKTRLVVLGACSSAGGLPVGMEGIAPLVRPIIGAGVPGVIGALWDIDDATATEVLVSFHRHYRQGSNAATALRNAQLQMLRSNEPGKTPARIWAPFEAIGYASSPFASIETMTKEKPP